MIVLSKCPMGHVGEYSRLTIDLQTRQFIYYCPPCKKHYTVPFHADEKTLRLYIHDEVTKQIASMIEAMKEEEVKDVKDSGSNRGNGSGSGAKGEGEQRDAEHP